MPAEVRTGTILAGFRVESLLGEGAMGTVYLAEETSSGRRVALKLLAPEELEMIFEEFKQATDGKRAEGTGLGLPLSRRLVELHGGRLWVESAAGKGSIFRFTLPVGPTEPASVLPN